MGKYTARQFWRLVGLLLGARTRRRIALSSLVLLQITCGFVLRPRREVYSSILAEFRAQSQHCKNEADLFYYMLRWELLLNGLLM